MNYWSTIFTKTINCSLLNIILIIKEQYMNKNELHVILKNITITLEKLQTKFM